MQTSSSEKGTITITAVDNGRLLNQEIVTQFSDAPVYDALSTIAYKCGLTHISAPAFKSTVSCAVRGLASNAIKEQLEQVTKENGIRYFYRVIGNCLVVKSFSDTTITPYYRPEDNIATAPCLLNATEYSRSEDAAEVRTSVQVVQTEDSGYSTVVYEHQSDYASERYGKINMVVEYHTYDTVSTRAKGIYNLYNKTDPTETYTISCAGSDKIVAGCKVEHILDGIKREMWVESVTHEFIPNHIVKLSLSLYKDPPTLEEMAALYTESSETTAETEDTKTKEEETEETEETEEEEVD